VINLPFLLFVGVVGGEKRGERACQGKYLSYLVLNEPFIALRRLHGGEKKRGGKPPPTRPAILRLGLIGKELRTSRRREGGRGREKGRDSSARTIRLPYRLGSKKKRGGER